jgi:predicted Abi (CAAX) family protease
MTPLQRRIEELGQAIRTWPDRRVWGVCCLVYALFLACVLPLATATGVARPEMAQGTWYAAARLALIVAVHPAFTEEFVFRGLLLPRPPFHRSRGARLLVAALALVLYVASHPLSAMLFRPAALPLFSAPAYLLCVTLLGATCTALYWISESLWPPVAVHWITVVAWLLCLGGQRLAHV